MTVVLVSSINKYVGLSTDAKHNLSESDAASEFHETDTDDDYIWTGAEWVPSPGLIIPSVMAGGITKVVVTDAATRELLEEILAELKKSNIHLQSMSDEEVP